MPTQDLPDWGQTALLHLAGRLLTTGTPPRVLHFTCSTQYCSLWISLERESSWVELKLPQPGISLNVMLLHFAIPIFNQVYCIWEMECICSGSIYSTKLIFLKDFPRCELQVDRKSSKLYVT